MTERITTPFFEFGPKTFLGRSAMLDIAEAAGRASERYDVAVIFTPPALDIEAIKSRVPALWVFAQGMDDGRPGRTTGAILPEALAAVGADGVLLNHAERPLSQEALRAAMRRADEAGLRTLVCANNTSEATLYASWSPDIVLLEPHDLIGTVHKGERPWIRSANHAIAQVNSAVLVMHSGGVAEPDDVRSLIAQGADGTGCTSAIVGARDPGEMAAVMIRAVREGWDERNVPVATSTTTKET
jgi:triosephosphate isomerase (TIM)